jgi:hypothetical protein
LRLVHLDHLNQLTSGFPLENLRPLGNKKPAEAQPARVLVKQKSQRLGWLVNQLYLQYHYLALRQAKHTYLAFLWTCIVQPACVHPYPRCALAMWAAYRLINLYWFIGAMY